MEILIRILFIEATELKLYKPLAHIAKTGKAESPKFEAIAI